MRYYNTRDILGHFVRPKSAKGDLCQHSCCMGRRPHPERFPLILPPRMLKQASDDELAEHYGRHHDCPKCQRQIVRELDRRDRVIAARKATGARNRARGEFRRAEVDRELLAAEAATNGYMVNKHGRSLGIGERSLFSGSEERAHRYATPELKAYWADHPRPTAARLSDSARRRRDEYARSDVGRSATVGRGRGRATVTITQ